MKNKLIASLFSYVGLFFYLLFFVSTAHSDVKIISDNISLKGTFTQGGLAIGTALPGSQVFYDDQPIRVSPQGDFVIGFNRDEAESVGLKIVEPGGKSYDQKIAIMKRDYQIQRINGLPKSKVSPRKPEVLARIRKESAQAKKARTLNDARLDYMESFIWPTIGPISGVYGSQRILNGKPRRPHFGVDVAAPNGTKVVAPASGIITLAHPDMFFSGGTIILDHGHGLSSTFLHLSKLEVKTGDVVKQGDLIARVGATGRVTGAHLDWRMNLFKRRVDPQLLVPPMETLLSAKVK